MTQSADVANEDRMYITAIKGVNVNEADWREATAEEKEGHEAELEKERKEKEKQNETA